MQHTLAPVLFVVFNRPETTARVFDAIRHARPAKLYIAADGPRPDKPGEAEKCEQVRNIARNVDWPCEVKTLFRDGNVGCGKGVSGAISWFFKYEPEGIILEDDCYPSQDFFRYCTELLAHYRYDSRVMEIAGSNMLKDMHQDHGTSYYFSDQEHVWGWATWRRAWKHYDYYLQRYPAVKDHGYFEGYDNSIFETEYFNKMYDRIYFENQTLTWWDYQWTFARRINSGVVVVPRHSMVMNIGMGMADATNMASNNADDYAGIAPMKWPLVHPPFMMIDKHTDDRTFRQYFTSRLSRLKSIVKAFFPLAAKAMPYLKDRASRFRRSFAQSLMYVPFSFAEDLSWCWRELCII